MLKLFKNLFPQKFKRSFKDHLGVPSLHWSLQNLKNKGFNPKQVVDVGAYEGFWTIDFLEVFTSAKVLMVEGQAKKKEKLEKVKNKYVNVDFAIELLSSTNNETVNFFEDETGSHIKLDALGNDNSSNLKPVKTKTLDTLLNEKLFSKIDFLKLDIQGHEIEALKGGSNALANAEFCLLEVTLIDLGNESPLFYEVNKFMDENGFQVYDICQFMRRPYDKALFQLDVLFVKKESKYVNEKIW